MSSSCPYEKDCSGCDLLHLTAQAQRELKLKPFLHLKPELKVIADHGLRSRLDFVISNGKIGLYQKNSKEIIDIESCLQLSPELQKFYQNVRQISFPIKKGSIRLRVSPAGKKGAWLDFSNAEIKFLLEEKNTLLKLQDLCFVEIGQRHKTLVQKTAGLGLGDPVLNPWFQTWKNQEKIDLFSSIASFTQPSHLSNQVITQTISQWISELKPLNVLEFGSGIGNLTFPALSHEATFVTATDIDSKALKGLEMSLKQTQMSHRVDIQCGDFRIKKPKIQKFDLLLLNPARNGVGQFLSSLLPLKPKHIIYMSCFAESYNLDTQNLAQNGYSLKKLVLIDQFPNTKHIEILSHWELT